MLSLFINDTEISNHVTDFSETIYDDSVLSLHVTLASDAFSTTEESSDALIEFAPFLANGSIHSLTIKNSDGDTLIYSSKYTRITRADISGNAESVMVTFSLHFSAVDK